jgi:hypothetical protein
MKRILIALIVIFATSCSEDYKNIDPNEINGVELKVDSAQWTPAMIKVEDGRLNVNESGQIKTVWLWSIGGTIVCAFLIGLVAGLMIYAAND